MSSWQELSPFVSNPSAEFMLTPPSSPEGGADGTRTPTDGARTPTYVLPPQPAAPAEEHHIGPLVQAGREIIWNLADLEKRTGLKFVSTSGYKNCCLSFSDLMATGELATRSQRSR